MWKHRTIHCIVPLTLLLISSIAWGEEGSVRIICNVEGAKYIIDEGTPKELKGTIGENAIYVSPGRHSIKVYKEGYLPYIDVFTVEPGEEIEVEAILTLYYGWISVGSVPKGAVVLIDGTKKGKTPLKVQMPRGSHKIQVFLKGYKPAQKVVKVLPGKDTRVDFTLALLPKSGGKPAAWYKNPWLWTGVGVAVIGGVTTAIILSRGGSNAPPTPDVTIPLW